MRNSTKKNERILEGGPNVFHYEDYRLFLKDVAEHLKSTRTDFSFRKFSRLAGLNTPNYLQMIMEGRRNLSLKSITKFALALQLNQKETEFFEALVQFTQAPSPSAKNHFYDRLKKYRGFAGITSIERDQMDYFSNWYNVAIREMVELTGFKEDASWISKRICPTVPVAKVKQAIDLLLRLKLLVRDSKMNLKQANPTLSTGAEVMTLSIINYHRQMLAQASRSIDEVPAEQRDVSALTLGLNRAHIPEIKKEIAEFRQNLLKKYGSSGDVVDEIYQLTLQFFPFTQAIKKGKNDA